MKRKKTKPAPKTKRAQAKPKAKKVKTDDVTALHDLFVEELKDIYWAEKALTKAIPKMIKNSSAPELSEALNNHLEETEEHVKRLEDVFAAFDEKVVAKKCEAMEGLIKEAEEIMKETEKGPVRDAAIILAGQKVEHYEIATYGTLCVFAKTLGKDDAVSLLEETLSEEKSADEKLTEIAESSINIRAAEAEESEEVEEEAGAMAEAKD